MKESPAAGAALRGAWNAGGGGVWGVESLAGVALGGDYGNEEAKEVGAAFREKRTPDVAKYR